MVRLGVRRWSWVALSSALALLVAILVAPSATAADDPPPPTVLFDYGASDWAYQQVPVGADDGGFADPTFDDSSWTRGQAGFGSTEGRCSWSNTDQVKTIWDPNTDILIRKTVQLPEGATALHIAGTIDDQAQVYVNGTLVASPSGGYCSGNTISVDVPDSLLASSTVIAIRGKDLGDSRFLDVRATGIIGLPVSTKQVDAPWYLAVSYIASFSITRCVANLVANDVPPMALVQLTNPAKAKLGQAKRALSLCTGLALSANASPPSTFTSDRFAAFAAKKDYRGYVAIPSYRLTCTSQNRAIDVTSTGQFAYSLGYTKDNAKFKTIYQLGDGYSSNNNFNREAPDVFLTPDGFTVSYKWSSRIATAERAGQYALSGYDAPFVWSVFEEKVGCDGSQSVRYTYSDFPTTNIYINGRQVLVDKQTSAIANFIKQGGNVLRPNGYGDLATPCHVKIVNPKSGTVAQSYAACQNGSAGVGGGGGPAAGGGSSW